MSKLEFLPNLLKPVLTLMRLQKGQRPGLIPAWGNAPRNGYGKDKALKARFMLPEAIRKGNNML
jgi:hypothetical protein